MYTVYVRSRGGGEGGGGAMVGWGGALLRLNRNYDCHGNTMTNVMVYEQQKYIPGPYMAWLIINIFEESMLDYIKLWAI